MPLDPSEEPTPDTPGIRGTRGSRGGKRRPMRTVAREVQRLAEIEVERQHRITAGKPTPEDLQILYPGTWMGVRAVARREADFFRENAKTEVLKQLAEPERLQRFIRLLDEGLEPDANPLAKKTTAQIITMLLKEGETSKATEDSIFERLGVPDFESLWAIVEKARRTKDMDDDERAAHCEQFLERYYGTRGRARQRAGIQRLGGELPVSSSESYAKVEP